MGCEDEGAVATRPSVWIPFLIIALLLPLGALSNGSPLWYGVAAGQALCGLWLIIADRHLAVLNAGNRAGREAARIRRVYLGLILALGLGPVIVQYLATSIAGLLGCYATEHGLYTRGQDYDPRGCRLGDIELNGVLHPLYLSVLLLIGTWPCTLAAVVILPIELIAWVRRRFTKRTG